jgi:hypothetical protein
MYNIFKPHVIYNEVNDRYYIRKYVPIMGWMYKSNNDDFWWNRVNDWNFYSDLETAIKHCKFKFQKVYP